MAHECPDDPEREPLSDADLDAIRQSDDPLAYYDDVPDWYHE